MNKCVFTIAWSTAREVTRQPLFYLILCSGAFLICLSFSFTLFAFGEETRMIREMGVSTITICCLCLASLSAADTISKEMEKGTIMTLLSKPVDKNSILLGKFFGILAAVSSIFIMMGILLTISLCVKESLDYDTDFLSSFERVGYSTVFQLLLSFLQVAILCAITVAGSVCLPLLANLSCCIAIYVTGNLINFFQGMFQMNGDMTPWYLMPFFTLFPNFEQFNTFDAGDTLESLSLKYMAQVTIYTMVYITFIIGVTCEIFGKKECR
ncbi:MAG: ABC transporter permease [Candidatus Brocadia sp.]|nr:ABC transporter permease [Candidatus Brocadia sp.]